MPHSLTYIRIHLIFSTKERRPIIKESFESLLYSHIKEKFINEYDSPIDVIGGVEDHLHILFNQSQNFALKDIVKNLKGETSHWINEKNYLPGKFVWQPGYAAFSISIDKVSNVRNYIHRQKEHHKKMSFAEEIKKILAIYGFDSETVETV
ncbi:MAG: IS200/IS605 family transposase [Bacteroidetes bacterium]|nr:IS200/IS605 family transposase [Bacteroidota bacterium]